MKKLLIFLSFVLLNLEVFGQGAQIKPEVFWGPELNQTSIIEEVIGNDSSGVYLVMKHVNEKSLLKNIVYTLDHRDYSLQLVNTKPFLYVQAGKKVEFFYSLGGITYIISSELNQLKNKVSLFVQTLNKNSLRFNVDIRKLTEFEMPSDNPFSYTFHMTTNQDKTRHLLTCIVYDSSFEMNVSILGRTIIGEDKRKQFFNFLVLDSAMLAKWELKNQTLPEKQILDYHEIVLSGGENVYMLSSTNNNAHKNQLNARNYSINCFNENGYQSGLALNMIECFSAELMLKTTESNEVICTGFYSKNLGEAQSTYYG